MNRQERRRLSKQSRRTANVGTATTSVADVMRQAFTFLQGGYPQESVRLYREVLADDPEHAEALNLCAIAHFQSGESAQAIQSLEKSISVKPTYVEAYNNLGNIYRALGNFEEAQSVYAKALVIDPSYFDAHFNQGILFEELGRLTDAADAYWHAHELNLDFLPVLFRLGNVLKTQGNLVEALKVYQQSITKDPSYTDAHINLGNVLHELGKPSDAVASYRRALALDSDHIDAHYNLGIALQEEDKLIEAVAAYQQVLELDSKHVAAQNNLGYALQKLGRLDDAVTAFRQAINIDPHHAQTHVNLGDALLESGKPETAIALCDEYLLQHSGNTAVLAFRAVALGELNDRKSVDYLLDYDRFMQLRRLQTPTAGYASLDDFNTALSHYVSSHTTLVSAPVSHATRLGRHSGELLGQSQGPIAVLEEAIQAAVKAYICALPADVKHPFVASQPNNFDLTAWGVVLRSKGHQLPHIHPSAWLSGVYYVQVPKILSQPGNGQDGWIEFGRAPAHFHCASEPVVKLIQPEEGLMLLFPSYFYHGTVPLSGDEQRISIAFDILPLPGDAA